MSNRPYTIAGTGSRSLVTDLLKRLEVLDALIVLLLEYKKQHGNVRVISGMAEGFDEALAIAAIIVEVPWIAAIPNKGYLEYYWGRNSLLGVNRLESALSLTSKAVGVVHICDSYRGVKYPFPGGANFDRNEWMVDNCDIVWAYDTGSKGTKHCYGYAQKTGKKVFFCR